MSQRPAGESDMDLGTVFGLAGLAVALVSLVYVRTQAAASRAQAEASAEQARIARRMAAIEISVRLAERVFDVRRDMLAQPEMMAAYWRANPQLGEAFDRAGGLGAVMVIRKMIDATQDMYLLRKERIVTDAHWRQWVAAFVPFTRMVECRAVFDNAVERGIYAPEFVAFCSFLFDGEQPPDPSIPDTGVTPG